jgi:tripartite-type tricarboxylate transporter receptor subunit TctC
VPARNVAEVIEWARAHPGAFYASPGSGTHHHLCMELLKQSTGIALNHVPYKGSAQAFSDLLGGQVPTMFMPVQVAAPQQQAGRLRILGGTLRQRHPAYPEIPTLQEQGVRDYEVEPWYGVWAPPRLPPATAARYREAIVAALAEPEVKTAFDKQGLIVKTCTPDELVRIARAEFDLWSGVVKAANIRPE